ncbi:MAG: hypothetical protein ACKVIN_13190, partial [Longimicrobiales bacterium]
MAERRNLISKRLPTAQAALLPVGFAAGIAVATRIFPQVAQQPMVLRSFLGASSVLLLGAVVL